ncbi:hypothetical protein ACTRXD_15575 [Nitrospira sp. T9]|uniref:hypothetical protein n=1 Tax=unclassified Nitrospira TaxID=2652172 RepID=UPI003F9A2B22
MQSYLRGNILSTNYHVKILPIPTSFLLIAIFSFLISGCQENSEVPHFIYTPCQETSSALYLFVTRNSEERVFGYKVNECPNEENLAWFLKTIPVIESGDVYDFLGLKEGDSLRKIFCLKRTWPKCNNEEKLYWNINDFVDEVVFEIKYP